MNSENQGIDDKIDYNEINMDIFKEIANVGVGSAANSLSTMLSSTIFVGTPDVYITEVENVNKMMGSPEELVTGIYLTVKGDVSGAVLMIIPCKSARTMLNHLLGSAECPENEFNENEISAIKEIGNIIGCSYLNAIGELLGLTIIPSTPSFAYDMVGAILDFSLIDLSGLVEKAMIFETDFFERKGGVKGFFIFLPEDDSIRKILSSARKKYGVGNE